MGSTTLKAKICTYGEPDLICISETHLADGSTIDIDGYCFYGKSQMSNRASGGVGVLVNNNTFAKYYVSVCCGDTDGILGVKLTHKRTGSQSVIVSNYLPPASSAYGKDCESFFDRLLVLSYELSNCEMVLYCGDFKVRIGNLQMILYHIGIVLTKL